MPYGQLPLQPLVRKDAQAAQGDAAAAQSSGLPVNVANGSINVDFGKMGAMAGVPGAGGQEGGQNGWGLLTMMRDAAAAVSPAGGQPGLAGSSNGGLAYNPNLPLQLPDGKRLAYRMDYCVRESGNSYVAAVTSHTSYWANRDIAFFILTKMFPELEQVPVPANVN